ncbi:MAG: sugar phosphate isomerase/epimerase [Candidatus Melainabacteria bacterium]|nr:sugar phosphate isomerase/epimerase [Candidatus Melainabacteria bacterium]
MMRLAVSNLAWDRGVEQEAFSLVQRAGFAGIEVAPTKIADWKELNRNTLESYRLKCEAAMLEVPSLQAIFYGCADAQLLGDRTGFIKMHEHLKHVVDIAFHLGASIAVFGAPKNRQRAELNEQEASLLAVERLRLLGDTCLDGGLVLAIEPVPKYYGSDFLTTASEVESVVLACDHAAVRIHLDCACIQLAGDDPVEVTRRLGKRAAHYHIAEPDLASFAEPKCDHKAIAHSLKTSGYAGWGAIEMRQQGENDLLALQSALEFAVAVYR